MLHQELDAKSHKGVVQAFRLCGFFLSLGILYLMIIWTLELIKVEVSDLPVVSALDSDFKRKPLEKNGKIIENGDLSINTLRGKENETNEISNLVVGTFEEELADEEKPVPLSMKEALEKSIAKALDTLTKEDIISKKPIYYVYIGSFDSYESALQKLKAIQKIDQLPVLETLKIVSDMYDGRQISYRLKANQTYTYEKAKQVCDKIISNKLNCKVITG